MIIWLPLSDVYKNALPLVLDDITSGSCRPRCMIDIYRFTSQPSWLKSRVFLSIRRHRAGHLLKRLEVTNHTHTSWVNRAPFRSNRKVSILSRYIYTSSHLADAVSLVTQMRLRTIKANYQNLSSTSSISMKRVCWLHLLPHPLMPVESGGNERGHSDANAL